MRYALPYARAGQTVGLLGGSFDPAHAGHVHITQQALKRFGLSRVWWLISPGNPLKRRGPAPMGTRMTHALSLMDHPRVFVSDIEAQLGTHYTSETIIALKRLYPQVRFVWLMGADNLAQFHRWYAWPSIMQEVPVGVMARPGDRLAARTSPAARRFQAHQISERASHLLPYAAAPAWCFVNIPMRSQSSSAIRSSGGWPSQDDSIQS